MRRSSNPNLLILEMAVNDLGDLVNEFVFLGGCATGLLIVDVAAPPIRETVDVDVIVQVLSKAEYYALSDRLRDAGFKEDIGDGAPICRWTNGRVCLDVMPTDPAILGFGNEWYAAAMAHAQVFELPSAKSIRLVSSPYFLITKLEAFDRDMERRSRSRGAAGSHGLGGRSSQGFSGVKSLWRFSAAGRTGAKGISCRATRGCQGARMPPCTY